MEIMKRGKIAVRYCKYTDKWLAYYADGGVAGKDLERIVCQCFILNNLEVLNGNKMLRDDGFLMKNNAPYQKYIDAGYFRRIEKEPVIDKYGVSHPNFMTLITGKGQTVLEKKYRKNGGV